MNTDLNFTQIIDNSLKNEGEYVNNPSDKGAETKFGISKRSYPELNIKNLTLEQAKAIYKRDFWDNQPYKNIENISIAGRVFDMSNNMGTRQAAILLQRALRACGNKDIIDDGIIGPATLNAANITSIKLLTVALKSESAGFYRGLVASNPKQIVFLKGWLNRAYA